MKKIYKLWALIVALFALGFVAFANAQQTNKTVTLIISSWTGNCVYSDYQAIEGQVSMNMSTAVGNPASYRCILGGGSSYVTVQAKSSIKYSSTGIAVPTTWILMRHIYTWGFNSSYTGELPPLQRDGPYTGGFIGQNPLSKCIVEDTWLNAQFTHINVARTLFKIHDTRECWYWNETALELRINPNTPVGTYSGDTITFILNN